MRKCDLSIAFPTLIIKVYLPMIAVFPQFIFPAYLNYLIPVIQHFSNLSFRQVAALLACKAFVVVHILSITIKKHIVLDKSTIDILSIVAPIFILLGVVALMAYYLVNNMPITLSNEIYYKQSVVNGKETGFIVHGMSYLYVNVLRGLFLIFGNFAIFTVRFLLVA